MKILVTGANGFVGKAVIQELLSKGFMPKAALRTEEALGDFTKIGITDLDYAVCGNIDANTHWQKILEGVDAIIHLAARVHILNETAQNPDELFRQTNVDGTLNLARQAASSQVKRMIFVSSIKVNGEKSTTPFTESDSPLPGDSYSKSKYEAEKKIMELADNTNMKVTVIRPPMIYGAGVKGNMLTLLQALRFGIPLPLAMVNNKRSFIYVKNLASALTTCITQQAAAGKTYLVSDCHDLSTSELIREIASGFRQNHRLFPIPVSWLRVALRLLGRESIAERLLDNLQINCNNFCQQLSWSPPYTVSGGIAEMTQWYLEKDCSFE